LDGAAGGTSAEFLFRPYGDRRSRHLAKRPAPGSVPARFCEAENSTGFHAQQEAARILGESIDTSRKGQIALRDGKLAAK
jgi:hypothetical protein